MRLPGRMMTRKATTMRILHTSDWHLGHMLKGWSRAEEHAAFLGWLAATLEEEQVDVLLVAGDIFDAANPPASAEEAWFAFLADARRRCPELNIVVIGGNHDSAARLDAPNPLLRAFGVNLVGGVPRLADMTTDWERMLVRVRSREEEAWVAAVPFLRAPDLPEVNLDVGDQLIEGVRAVYREAVGHARARSGTGAAVMAMGHLYAAGTQISESSERRVLGGNQHGVPHDVFPDDLAYVALGHLHRAQAVGGRDRVRYCGSPIPLSTAEKDYEHQVVVTDLRGGHVENLRSLLVPRRSAMLRIPAVGSATLPNVLREIAALPRRDSLPEPLRPFLDIAVALDGPEPTLQQQVHEALRDRAVRFLSLTREFRGADQPLAAAFEGRLLDSLTPEEVFVACHRRAHNAPPSPELLAAFHELIGASHAEAA